MLISEAPDTDIEVAEALVLANNKYGLMIF